MHPLSFDQNMRLWTHNNCFILPPQIFSPFLLSAHRGRLSSTFQGPSWAGGAPCSDEPVGLVDHMIHTLAQSMILLTHSHSRSPLAVFFIHPFMSFDLSPIPLQCSVLTVSIKFEKPGLNPCKCCESAAVSPHFRHHWGVYHLIAGRKQRHAAEVRLANIF